jgi:hypothetical protein
MAANDYAILVGITRYPRLGNLQGPENDAVCMHDWLIDQHGGQVPRDHITLIRSSDYSDHSDPLQARPITADINLAFERLLDESRRQGGEVGRRLYIFLAGHGFAPHLEEVALLMANANRWRPNHYIPGRQYARDFRGAALFREVVLLMDCCRHVRSHVPLFPSPWGELEYIPEADVRHFYGFATEWSRAAREHMVSSSGAVQGIFTQAVLAGLRGGAVDKQHRITSTSLEAYVQQYIEQHIPAEEYHYPQFDYMRHADIVFAEQIEPARTRVCITFAQSDEHIQLICLDQELQTIARHMVQTSTWEFSLQPGLYMIAAQTDLDRRQIFCVTGAEEEICVRFG